MTHCRPNRSQLLCYQLGVALGQVWQLHDSGMPVSDFFDNIRCFSLPGDVLAFSVSLQELQRALGPWTNERGLSGAWQQDVTGLLDDIRQLWGSMSELWPDDLIRLDSSPVILKLNEIDYWIQRVLEQRGETSERDWYRLGVLVVRGKVIEVAIPNPKYDPKISPGQQDELWCFLTGEYEWRLAQQDAVQKLLDRVHICWVDLFPEPDLDDDTALVLPNLPSSLEWAYARIQTGIRKLAMPILPALDLMVSSETDPSVEPVVEPNVKDSSDGRKWRDGYLGLRFDDCNHVIGRAGRDETVDLAHTHHQWAILLVLDRNQGAIVSSDGLLKGWHQGDTRTQVSNETARSHISRLRAALKPLGIDIKNTRGLGYLLVELCETAE